MAEKANIIQRVLGRLPAPVRNYVFPTPQNPISGTASDWRGGEEVKKDLRGYITPVQLQRLRHDIQMWRNAIVEAEQAWYPHRVRMQRMFIDVVLQGHVLACIQRRKNLSLLREWQFLDEQGNENEQLKKLFDKKWFSLFLEYALEAKFFGYSLIALGDVDNDEFPELSIIRRFNISPDRLNVTSYVYSLSGAQFLEEPYRNWHVWVSTPSDVGVSKVGYGLLYSVALYDIYIRNLLGQNVTSAELFGMPIRKATTTKTDETERGNLENMLANMGSAGWVLLDPQDELELIEATSNGAAYKIFPDLEQRLEKKISKILLGHADALDSTPGKLGAGQGGAESAAGIALMEIQSVDGAFLEDVVNGELIPRMRALGFVIDESFKFKFSNNLEVAEKRREEDAANKVTADIAQVMKNAGLVMDAAYFEERTGIPTTAAPITALPPAEPFSNKIKNKLKELYK